MALILFLLLSFHPIKQGYGAEIQPVPGQYLRQGEVAPFEGILFFRESLRALSNALTELDARREQVKLLEAQVEALKGQTEEQKAVIVALEEAKAKTALALDRAEFILGNFKIIEAGYKDIIGIYKQALADVQESKRQLQDDLQSARNEIFWTKILGLIPIIGLVATIIGGL